MFAPNEMRCGPCIFHGVRFFFVIFARRVHYGWTRCAIRSPFTHFQFYNNARGNRRCRITTTTFNNICTRERISPFVVCAYVCVSRTIICVREDGLKSLADARRRIFSSARWFGSRAHYATILYTFIYFIYNRHREVNTLRRRWRKNTWNSRLVLSTLPMPRWYMCTHTQISTHAHAHIPRQTD